MSLKQEPDAESTGSAANEPGTSAKTTSDGEQKRPYLTKFATIHTDKYPHIRRDFPLTNFDRNLTIEKAHFEPHPADIEADTNENPPQPSPPNESPPLASSASTTAMSAASTITPAAIKALPTKSKSEPDRSSRTTKKRRRPPPVSGTATPSEVFHRNLIDAVSNVEDSDENEQYVYPYSSNHNDPAYHHHPAKYHAQPSVSPVHDSRLGGFLADIFRRKNPIKSRDEEVGSPGHRPKLRSYVMDRPPQRSKDATFSVQLNKGEAFDGRISPRFRSRRPGEGYASDDEGTSLLRLGNAEQDKTCCSRILRNTLLALLTLGVLAFFLITYPAKPLEDVSVEMGRVLASDKELIFDLHVTASNMNWWTMRVEDADISVFAFSQVVPMQINANAPQSMQGVDPAEYLGSCHHFDEPLSFRSSLFSRRPETAVTQIRIRSPGADKSGNERWSRIIRYPYGLVARGVLKYQRTPMGGLRRQSSAICDVAQIDPTTGDVSEDPDQGFCLSYEEP